MPGKRAAGVTVRNFPVRDTLWSAAKVKAAQMDVSLADTLRRLLTGWVGGQLEVHFDREDIQS